MEQLPAKSSTPNLPTVVDDLDDLDLDLDTASHSHTNTESENDTNTNRDRSDSDVPLDSITSDYVYYSDEHENEDDIDHDNENLDHDHDIDIEELQTSSNNGSTTPVLAIAIVDDASGELDREYTGQFEGPEKTLEVCFRRKDGTQIDITLPNQKAGLRLLPRADLDAVCKRARCTIISSITNQYLDAYVLSESSLFVYNYMIVIKTCGSTTLLRCLALLIELGRRLDLELDWVGYSRKNFNFPDDQCFPHGSFTQELEYLYGHRRLCEKLDGNGYTLGPITSDHWFLFVADQTVRSKPDMDNDRVLNIMMFDIDLDVAELFYYSNYEGRMEGETEEEATRRISFAQTKAAGIDALCPGALFDPRAFEPCGYSMNAILYKSYYTMHITPEEGSSYASFETNQKLASYTSLINNVVRTFRPRRIVMTLMADEGGLKEIKGNPLVDTAEFSRIVVPAKNKASKDFVYKRTNIASVRVEDDCCCMMGNWTIKDDNVVNGKEKETRYRGMSIA
jgi:S-adenosylmethionine decarboxylase